jgi:hypothetical protein
MKYNLLIMETQNTYKAIKRQRSERASEEDDGDSSSFPRFLIVSANDQQPLKYNVFAIQKFIQCAVGDVKSAKKLRNGNVLIEVLTKEQAKKALAMHTWFDTEITVTPHRTLNTSRGVIRCRELRDCSDDDVLTNLTSQGVTEVKHIMSKRADKAEPTSTFILTFNTPTPPKDIRAAYMKIDVDPYIPNPLRCFKCQRFGHGKNFCNRNSVCARCGQEGHEDTDCQASAHCANCSGNHPAYSRDCPTWAKQREITQMKFGKNISFFEAKKLVEQHTASTASANRATGTTRTGVSYAGVCSPVTTTHVSVQTDLTWPLGSTSPATLPDVAPKRVSTTTESQTESVGVTLKGAAGEGASKTGNTNIPRYGPKPGPAPKTLPNRGRKGSQDPIQLFNRFGTLGDEMDLDRSCSLSPRGRKPHK